MRIGVLDVGSNTVHLLVVDAHDGAAPVPAFKHSIPLRMSEHVTEDGLIDEDAVAELCLHIRASQNAVEDMGATEFMAFATSAIREAPNGEDVVRQVRERTGVDLEVLTGDEEARLTFLAVRRWFGWSAGRILVLDIGGGSLEIAVGTDEEPEVAVSVPVGAGRMTRNYVTSDPANSDDVRAMRKYVRSQIAEVAGRILRVGEPRISVATSKTFKQLARIAGAAPSSDGPFVRRTLSQGSLQTWVPKLSGMTAPERATLPGVSQGRAAQILAGAVVAEAAMDLLNVVELDICPWALREGIILRRIDWLHQ